MWTEPVCDRTIADIEEIKSNPLSSNTKGAFNCSDLNRIERNSEYIYSIMQNEYGIPCDMTFKTNWAMQDIPTINQINRIRKNVMRLKQNLPLDDWKDIEFTKTMNYTKANNIEYNLSLIKNAITSLNRISGSGTDIYLSPTGIGRLNIIAKGNTYQYNSDGYNYLPNNFTSQVINGITFVVNEDGTISANGTATEDISISVSGNSGVPFEARETAIAKGCPSDGSAATYHVTISKVVGGVISTITTLYGIPDDTNVFTANAGDEVFYNIVIKQGCVCRKLLFKPMISSSSTVIDYEPYTAYEVVPTPDNPKAIKSATGIQTIRVSKGVLSQEININLGNIELNSIGDHIDYIDGTPDNWVLHKNVCSILLDGSENYTYIGRSSSCRKFSFEPTNEKANLIYGDRNMLSNNFINIEATDTYSEGIYEQPNDNLIYFRILGTRASSVNNLKTWLSTHNTKILYKLKNEITETITDATLIGQLNNMYYLQSYNDETIINISGDLPMTITASVLDSESGMPLANDNLLDNILDGPLNQ